MKIFRKARGTEIQRQQQRVFLCWHPEDTEGRDMLVKDLLSHDAGADCVVSWLENPAGDLDETLLQQELLGTQLFIFFVTLPFLERNKYENTMEFRIAKEIDDLPKLPIAANTGLFPALTEQEHAVHGIAMDDSEYRVKLQAQLSNFIASNDLIKDITEKAFTGRLFLSYRKMDIGYARTFMKKFHDIQGFESIAIWYDNFLTAGRVFDEEIRTSIDSADVFVLLVTPNLLLPNDEGKSNYVLAEELPYAVRSKKKIVAVEAVKTSKNAFSKACLGVKSFVSIGNLNSFSKYLPDEAFLCEIGAEQKYFLGEAFLKGVMIEKDVKRGVAFLKDSGDQGNMSAIKAMGVFHNEMSYQIHENIPSDTLQKMLAEVDIANVRTRWDNNRKKFYLQIGCDRVFLHKQLLSDIRLKLNEWYNRFAIDILHCGSGVPESTLKSMIESIQDVSLLQEIGWNANQREFALILGKRRELINDLIRWEVDHQSKKQANVKKQREDEKKMEWTEFQELIHSRLKAEESKQEIRFIEFLLKAKVQTEEDFSNSGSWHMHEDRDGPRLQKAQIENSVNELRLQESLLFLMQNAKYNDVLHRVERRLH